MIIYQLIYQVLPAVNSDNKGRQWG